MTVRNRSPRPVASVLAGMGLPGKLPPSAVDRRCDLLVTTCSLGGLGAGEQTHVVVRVPPRAPVTGRVAYWLAATTDRAVTVAAHGSVRLRVSRPAITVDPPVGRPGDVPVAHGVRFPPGTWVRVTWQPGVTAEPAAVRVRRDGTFDVPRMVLRDGQTGPRALRVEPVHGRRFAPVVPAEPFLVQPPTLDPVTGAGW